MHIWAISLGLPARFLDAGQLASMRLLSQADPADLEESKVAVLTATELAAVVSANLEFRFSTLLFNKRLLRHISPAVFRPVRTRVGKAQRLFCG
jgi:hypothetical protein